MAEFRYGREEVLGAPGQEKPIQQHWLLDNGKPKHSPALGIQEQEVPGSSSLRQVMSRLDFATVDVDTAKCALNLILSRYASTGCSATVV